MGLVGGSVAWGAKDRRLAEHVLGVDTDAAVKRRAEADGVVDGMATLADGVSGADMVVLAVPVGRLEVVAREASALLKGSSTVVTDVGSVKAPVVARLEPLFTRFVGCHPMAGSERSGLAAASASLFDGAPCVVTPTPHTDPGALELAERLWKGLGTAVVRMEAGLHDELVAAVSHLPHLVAASLVNTVARVGDGQALALAAGGFRDTTRIASGAPELWRDICLMNEGPVLKILAAYITEVQRLRDAIARADGQGLQEVLAQAQQTRERLTEGKA